MEIICYEYNRLGIHGATVVKQLANMLDQPNKDNLYLHCWSSDIFS